MDHPDITALNNIHDLLVDGRLGYAEASENVEDDRVKGLLKAFSEERVALANAVAGAIHRLDPTAPVRDAGTVKGDLHRAWMDIRNALSRSDNASMLSECERGEGYLLMRYDEILAREGQDPQVRELLMRQRAEVERNVSRVKELRQRFDKIEQ